MVGRKVVFIVYDHPTKQTTTSLQKKKADCYSFQTSKQNHNGYTTYQANRHRLRGEDKLRYEIFDAIKAVLPQSKNWKDFIADLDKQGIATRFKTKGNTDVVQGIIFEKDGCSFSGSKIDRSCSFSRLNAEIKRNIRQAQQRLSKEPMAHSTDESGFKSDLSDALSEVFTMPMPSGGIDVDELRFQKKLRNRANRKRRI